MAAAADRTTERRRRLLESLAREAKARGLDARLTGRGEPMLQVSDVGSGRGTLVVAVQTSRVDWSFLWGGGGQLAATEPARAADLIAEFLGG